MGAKLDLNILVIQKFRHHISIYVKRNRISQTSQHGKVLVAELHLFLDPTAHSDAGQLETAQNGYRSQKCDLGGKTEIICVIYSIKKEGSMLTVFKGCL